MHHAAVQPVKSTLCNTSKLFFISLVGPKATHRNQPNLEGSVYDVYPSCDIDIKTSYNCLS